MKKIKLTQNKFALVDDQDFEWLSQWKWFVSDNGYACRHSHIKLATNQYSSKTIRMHRLINQTPVGLFTDHINQDKLDNQRHNLRTVNKSQNGFNRGKLTSNRSGHKGVYWDSWSQKWKVEIKIMYKKISLGRYKELEDAVKARKEGEKIYVKI